MSDRYNANTSVPISSIDVIGCGYSIVSRDAQYELDLSELSPLCRLDFDEYSAIEQWLLEKVLRIPKNRKFMGRQDVLAVTAAARALLSSGLLGEGDGHGFEHHSELLARRCGVYMAVGYIPFEYDELDELSRNSQIDNEFSMARFSTQGIAEVNPLLTFRCLPNMPAFHVSMNFALQGPYAVSYPDIGQFYQVLNQAVTALRVNAIDIALVGGVADQNNFLVQHQLRKLGLSCPSLDAAAFLVLSRKGGQESKDSKPKIELIGLDSHYQALDLMRYIPDYRETLSYNDNHCSLDQCCYLGPASLALLLCAIAEQAPAAGEIQHRVNSSANLSAASHWLVLQSES